MKVCVAGLWHLGAVTAASLASVGHEVTAHDADADAVAALAAGTPPIFEPGLEELVGRGLAAGTLRPVADAAVAVRGAQVVWITYDTPVDEQDAADVDHVLDRVRTLLPLVDDGAVVLISSQVPVGCTARLQAEAPAGVSLAYSPENLRLGSALRVFLEPDRVVVGTRDDRGRRVVAALLAPVTDRIEWMGVESAEMAKHALNAFLATSVTFINEIAAVCERVGADAADVSRALKSEERVGPRAYLGPGGAFAGGTLARDVRALTSIGDAEGLVTPLLHGVWDSNTAHRGWPRRTIGALLAAGAPSAAPDGLAGETVAVWGLTYKPGTDTLRRSSSVELCHELLAAGATVRAHDPAVRALPSELSEVTLMDDPFEAARGADALVIATEWPAYRELDATQIADVLGGDLVVDANGFLAGALAGDGRVRYASVGRRPA
ncbi:MAG TPA: nucleotide sugar dehydrogenase [Baekduia sp.]|uniref:UDP-glucose dehydrogenase family protein n=1 Tax=Baekduia sp. TaxID=2600305 RepID=UPI002BDCCABF|nr:nucleotide sugar dehydrogenase [Baekduia sp.]HMJ36401.1 nucleotide sugar dehydrogenase [Baekduia sp.]